MKALILSIIATFLLAGIIMLWRYLKKRSQLTPNSVSIEYPAYVSSPTIPLLNISAQARLEVLSGPAQGRTVFIHGTTFLIERHPRSLLLNDLRVSRRHALLQWQQGAWFVRDLNSKNGTYLDENKLIAQQLVPVSAGSILRFGESCVRMVSGNEPALRQQEFLPSATVLATASYGRDQTRMLSQHYTFKQQPVKGGFALVFQGLDHQTGRQVGLKVLPDYANVSPNVRLRFEREGAALLNLSHPHIVEIYDWGRTKDGPTAGEALYILMEWMDGLTLRHRMKNPQFYREDNLEQILQIVMGVCRALDYAHRVGVIHRDIKPENIMFTKNGVVKVVDFGVANVADEFRMTEIGTLIGTPSYMSPEQAKGERVTARSDIYAIAVVTFEMLTGHRLFQGDPFMIIEHHIHTAPPPPTTINPYLPAAINDVLLCALEKDPKKRFASACEFSNALAQGLNK